MGCCQSDLKGEKQSDIANEAPQPVKKIQTNFSTIDYEAAPTGRRDTIVAPDEHRLRSEAQASPPEKTEPNPTTITSATGGTQDPVTRNNEGQNLEPYKDVTASPVSPVNTNPIDATVPQSQAQPVPENPEKLTEKHSP